MLICGVWIDRIGGGNEQVTIVRFAIEEILERVIDPHPHALQVCVRAHVNVCICVEITCPCGQSRKVLSCDRYHGGRRWLVGTAPCSKQHSGLTLDISEAGHARATCLLTAVPSPRQVNFNWSTNLSFCLVVCCVRPQGLQNMLIFEETTNCIAMNCHQSLI